MQVKGALVLERGHRFDPPWRCLRSGDMTGPRLVRQDDTLWFPVTEVLALVLCFCRTGLGEPPPPISERGLRFDSPLAVSAAQTYPGSFVLRRVWNRCWDPVAEVLTYVLCLFERFAAGVNRYSFSMFELFQIPVVI